MMSAGLMSGDTAIVMRNALAEAGAIVVAIVDQKYIVRYLEKNSGGFYLKPGNKEYRDYQPNDPLEICGVVTGSFRKY
jgi:repressor LexA